jgi:ribokinase
VESGSADRERAGPIVVVGAHAGALFMHVEAIPAEGQLVSGWGFRVPEDGGKATNQAIAAARLGADVALVTVVGNDALGRSARASLQRNGVDTRWVFEADGPTDVGFVCLPPSKVPAITTTRERSLELDRLAVDHAADLIRSAAIVVCQLEAPQRVALQAFRLARAAGVRTILNPAPAQSLDEELVALTDVLVPNEHEARYLDGAGGPPSDSAIHLARRWPSIAIVVTAGHDGAYVIDRASAQPTHIRPPQVAEVVDTTGAGDAFIGALAFGLCRGDGLVQAARVAVRAASISVARPGTIPAFASPQDFLTAPPAPR